MGSVVLAAYYAPGESREVVVRGTHDAVWFQRWRKSGTPEPDIPLLGFQAREMLLGWCTTNPADGDRVTSEVTSDGAAWLRDQGVEFPRQGRRCPQVAKSAVLGQCIDPGTTMTVGRTGKAYYLEIATVGPRGSPDDVSRDTIAKDVAIKWLRQFRAHGTRKGSAQECGLTAAGNALLRENPKQKPSKRCRR